MKAEREILEEAVETIPEMDWPEPQSELGAKLVALAKEVDKSGLPKLSIEEIEEYLGRELGGIAAAYEDTTRRQNR